MATDVKRNVRASRLRVSRSRGALSGVLLLIFGAWAALVPFIGPYFDLAFTPAPDDAWHWTTARGWLEVLPGAVAFLGGLLLLLSSNRLVASFGGWLGVAAGAWLVVGPSLTEVLNLDAGAPDPSSGEGVRALAQLLFFFGIGAAILFVAALGIGRLSVHSVRDVRAAERRAVDEERAAEEARRAEAERVAERERVAAGSAPADTAGPTETSRAAEPVGRHEVTNEPGSNVSGGYPPGSNYPAENNPSGNYPSSGYASPSDAPPSSR